MKHYLFLVAILVSANSLFAQPTKKPVQQKQPTSQPDMNKMMEEAMKNEGMSKEEQEEMKKMMKDIMPVLTDKSARMASYPDFTTNKELVPKRDAVRIASISKKKITQTDISSYASNLYSKIMAKGNAAEITLIKSILPKTPKPNDLSNASIICMMQGHPEAAMALSMKAVQASPANSNFQNNMAALLTQYGYPEQALPVLIKLKNEFPNNSTVLNNIGQAWFSLGDLDSAKRYFTFANRINPYHPDAKLCGGLIEELKGDPIKAEKEYVEAMEHSPNPVIDKILKNKTGDKGFDKIDFEKLKRSITIYEYFPKDWIKIPKFTDNVSAHENNMSTSNGFNKMLEELKQKIETLQEAAAQESETLMNKGEDEFVKEMAKANIQGINKMSLTAVTVQKILQMYIARQTQEDIKEYMELQKKKEEKRKEMTKSGKNDKCPDYDRKNNEYLSYINPLIREFHEKRIERFRNWLNAFCTWVWYITGNPKNTVMMQCIGWTAAMVDYVDNAFNDQETIAKTCVNQKTDGSIFAPTPEIPNFSCPTLVKAPVGPDWQELSNAAKNFDLNSLGIKNNPASPIPNHTLAFGGDHKSIAQPGIAPFVQTEHGSLSPGMINDMDDELVPIPKIPKDDDLAPLTKIPLEELTPLPDLRRAKMLKDLLNKMMSADCKSVKSPKEQLKESLEKMMKGVKELDAYNELKERLKKFSDAADKMEAEMEKKQQIREQIEKLQKATDELDRYEEVAEKRKNIEKIIKEMDAMDDKKVLKDEIARFQQKVDEIENAPAVLKEIQQNGIQPSINSGVQVPSTFTPIKGLFN